MVKQILTIIIIHVFLSSCTTIKSGEYHSSCTLHNQKSIIINLYSNNTFDYQLAYLDKKITGTWKQKGNKLIFESSFFTDKRNSELPIELLPSYKFTDVKGVDIFLIRGKKLIPVREKKTSCFLKKVY